MVICYSLNGLRYLIMVCFYRGHLGDDELPVCDTESDVILSALPR